MNINLKVNNIATIRLVQSFDKVTYYTLCPDNDPTSLFEQFVQNHTSKNKDKLNHILAWMKVIGDIVGARAGYFRNEAESADTSALPPKGVDREPTYVEYNDDTGTEEVIGNNLRLYCLRANEHVVFLFNGDVKTAAKAQDCDQVRPHFRLANKLTKVIDDAFREGDIKWDDYNEDVLFDDDLELLIE